MSTPAATAPTAADQLLNVTQLAQRLGVNRRFVTAMKNAGFAFNLGGRTTHTKAMQWLEEHPKFKPPPRAKKKPVSFRKRKARA